MMRRGKATLGCGTDGPRRLSIDYPIRNRARSRPSARPHSSAASCYAGSSSRSDIEGGRHRSSSRSRCCGLGVGPLEAAEATATLIQAEAIGWRVASFSGGGGGRQGSFEIRSLGLLLPAAGCLRPYCFPRRVPLCPLRAPYRKLGPPNRFGLRERDDCSESFLSLLRRFKYVA